MAINANNFFNLEEEARTQGTLGGKKLTKISPNKTYVGVFGGFLLSLIAGLIYLNYFEESEIVDTDYIINNYGNRIDYQVMPILYREQNHSFLGRAAHQTNANDERGYQIELSGGLPNGFQIVSQYSHLSRNDTWTSESPIEWTRKKICYNTEL